MPNSLQPLKMGECDCFVLAMERAMTRSGQGIHLSQTVLEIEGELDLSSLRTALTTIVSRHPQLTFQTSYPGIGKPPELTPSPAPATSIPLYEWSEGEKIESANGLLHDRLNIPEEEFNAQGTTNAIIDFIRCEDGRQLLAFTWRHIIFDGVGAELLLCEVAALATGEEAYVTIAVPDQERPGGPDLSFGERWKRAKPMADRFEELLKRSFKSLSGPKLKPGKVQFDFEVLSEADTTKVQEAAAKHCGPLITMPYFLACATQAHHRVWERRDTDLPESYLVTLPVQRRKAGAKGPLFQNNISMVFFSAPSEDANNLSSLCKGIAKQHGQFLKERLGDAFLHLQFLMRRMPPRLYVWFLQRQMKGEFNSFYHSNTGELAPDLKRIAGARVTNAYHIPTISNPPGTGLFVNTKSGRMTAVMTWRDGVLTKPEQKLLLASFVDALVNGGSQ